MDRYVQRYNVKYAHDIIQAKDGEFVTYEIYMLLKAEKKRLKEVLERIETEAVNGKSTTHRLAEKLVNIALWAHQALKKCEHK